VEAYPLEVNGQEITQFNARLASKGALRSEIHGTPQIGERGRKIAELELALSFTIISVAVARVFSQRRPIHDRSLPILADAEVLVSSLHELPLGSVGIAAASGGQ